MSSAESGDEEVQFTFTEQQLLILHEEKDSYRDTNKKLRQKKVNEIFKRMKTLDNEDKEFSSKKDAVLMVWSIIPNDNQNLTVHCRRF
jgi:DNA-directed RNA polymerase beta' subunit